MMARSCWIFALLAGLILVVGCVTPRTSPLLEARGVAAIEGVRSEDVTTSATIQLEWAGGTLGSKAVVPIDPGLRGESESLALASARLAARDQLRADIKRQLHKLPVHGPVTLEEAGTENPGLAARISTILDGMVVVESREGDAATASAEIPLEGVATAVLDALPSESPDPPPQSEVILAEAAAQRIAFERARTELRGKLFSTRVRGSENIDTLLRKYPAEQAAVQAWLFNARTVSSQRLPGDRWEILLQADATPIIRRFEILEDARPPR